MTTIEILTLVQTIILFLTGFAVFWYTMETQKIRKETTYQNTILKEQYIRQQKQEELQLTKELTLSDPDFSFTFGQPSERTSHFINKGASIKNLSISPFEKYSISIQPSRSLKNEETGKIIIPQIPNPRPEILHFKISYENSLEIIRTKYFEFIVKDALFREVRNFEKSNS